MQVSKCSSFPHPILCLMTVLLPVRTVVPSPPVCEGLLSGQQLPITLLRPGHPHFTAGVRLRTKVLPDVERRGFQPQGTSLELPSGESVLPLRTVWGGTLPWPIPRLNFKLGCRRSGNGRSMAISSPRRLRDGIHVSSQIHWLRL